MHPAWLRSSRRARGRLGLTALAVACLTVAALTPPTEAKRRGKDAPPPEHVVVPDPERIQPPYTLSGRAVELQMHGVRLRVEPLDEGRRAAWFAVRTPLAGDPLPGRDTWPEGFVVFDVGVSNASPGTVTYSPGTSICWHSKDHELRRLQIDQVLELLRSQGDPAHGADASQLVGLALSTFHLEPLVLAPGESASRLLVYKGDPKARDLRLDLHRIDVGGEVLHPRLEFDVVAE